MFEKRDREKKIGFIKRKYHIASGLRKYRRKERREREEHACPRVREKRRKREKFILLWGRIL